MNKLDRDDICTLIIMLVFCLILFLCGGFLGH